MKLSTVAVKGKPVLLDCGAEGCTAEHTCYLPEDVLVIEEAIRLDDDKKPLADRSVDKGLMKLVELDGGHGLAAVPTLLGLWVETANQN